MTIGEVLKLYPKIETDLLLAHTLNTGKEFLFLNPNYRLTTKQFNNFTKLIAKRQRGVPAAYLLGYKDFYGLRFKVKREVLIPRPESEWLVERALSAVIPEFCRRQNIQNPEFGPKLRRRFGRYDKIKILDMGTGSGCLAIALATFIHDCMNVEIWAADISKKALAAAGQNANAVFAKNYRAIAHDNFCGKANATPPQARIYHAAVRDKFWRKTDPAKTPPLSSITYHSPARDKFRPRAKIKFVRSNLFSSLPQKFDLILANLPYVPPGDYKKFREGLKYEPKLALLAKNRWQIYAQFLKQVATRPNPGAVILLETDPGAKKYLLKYLFQYLPRAKYKFFKDLAGRWRYCEIRINHQT